MSVIGSTQLRLSEEQAMLLDVAKEFCRDKSPIAVVRQQLETPKGYDSALWDEMVSLGWTGIALPEMYGGSGLGVGALVPVVECMGRAMLGTPLISTVLAGHLVLRAGSPSQQEAWLPAIAAGEAATLALLENGDWGDDSVALTLGPDGVLQGSKVMVADASAVHHFIVSVQYQGDIALAVVNASDVPQSSRYEHVLIDQTKRACSVDFSGVRVASEAIITGERVAAALHEVRLLGALLVAAEAAGSAGACLDTMVDYLKTRKQFGRLIGSYQALKHPAVEILMGLDDARSFVYHAASLVDEADATRDAEVACRMAKVQAAEVLRYAGDRAVQFHGGMGFTYECDAQLYIRRAQWSSQQFGDAQHHRKRLAALLLD